MPSPHDSTPQRRAGPAADPPDSSGPPALHRRPLAPWRHPAPWLWAGLALLLGAGLAAAQTEAPPGPPAEAPAEAPAAGTPPAPAAGDPSPTPQAADAGVAAGYPIGRLIPDNELVYGPAAAGFDTAAFVAEAGGYLARYQELVDGAPRSGAEIVERVAAEYSVSPRLLLALIEARSAWVSDPAPQERDFPAGGPLPGLAVGLAAAADGLNAFFYGHLYDGLRSAPTADGRVVAIPESNAATFALLALLGSDQPAADWAGLEGPSRFYAAWARLFGDPLFNSVAPPPLVPPASAALPFPAGEIWFFTAGPHSPAGAGGPRAALDFAPPPESATGCTPSAAWVTAARSGWVLRSEAWGLAVDTDGDRFEGTGWVDVYRHLAAAERVAAGTRVQAGDRLGHPSCEGGLPGGQTRVAFSRKHDGAWVPADLPAAPLVLGGWAAAPGPEPGQGWLVRDGFPPRVAGPTKAAAVNGVGAPAGAP